MVAMRHVQIGLCLLSGARCSLGGDEEEEHLWSVDIGGGGGEGIADPSYGLCNAEATDAWIAPTVLRTLFLVQVEPMISCQLVDPEPYLQHSHCLTWLGWRGNKSRGRPIGSSSGRIRNMQYRPFGSSVHGMWCVHTNKP